MNLLQELPPGPDIPNVIYDVARTQILCAVDLYRQKFGKSEPEA
jgi:hypothetical protein